MKELTLFTKILTRLSRILARVLRALYGIQTPSMERHLTLAAEFTQALADWREDISYLLDADGSSAMFIKLVLRQRDVLQMALCHARILIYRPFLLPLSTVNNSSNIVPDSEESETRRDQMQEYAKRCVEAATQIAEHINQIDDAGELYSTLFVRCEPSICSLHRALLTKLLFSSYLTTDSTRWLYSTSTPSNNARALRIVSCGIFVLRLHAMLRSSALPPRAR